ncbi:MAG: hypothetical protein ABI347_01750 [Nitrososphaera sp.]|jgi:hypothetical protein
MALDDRIAKKIQYVFTDFLIAKAQGRDMSRYPISGCLLEPFWLAHVLLT